MILYAATLFLSAFLLFSVQPVLGKYILPWFGGAPSVWTSCMLFFQLLLLAGYGYAHFLAGRRSAKVQGGVHLLLLAASVVALPILPAPAWKGATTWPALGIPALLAVCVGFPYFALSSSSPLLQAWFGTGAAGRVPYRLYAVSNAGSLLAVLMYPFLIEPALPIGRQAAIWQWGYAVFVVCCGWCAVGLWRRGPFLDPPTPPRERREREGRARRALWFLLPACSSVLLLATTNQLCQDVAVVPLLWVVPLALYLASFILCFDSPRWYSRLAWGIVFAAALTWSCAVLFQGVFARLDVQIASCTLTLFAGCMVCHGELFRLRPGLERLTAYYATIAAGGAAGGLFVALLAPAVFSGYWEYHLGLFMTAALFLASVFTDESGPLRRGRPVVIWIPLLAVLCVFGVTLAIHQGLVSTGNIEMSRNFFGVMRVFDEDLGDPRLHRVTLMHGRIQHGSQFQAPFRRGWPTAYYGPESGVGLALRYLPGSLASSGESGCLRVGVVGLGVGTVAAYGRPGDYFRFYEINPEVVRFAGTHFTFLKNCPAAVDIVLGDARISLGRELERGERQNFDLLIVDAFSGDAIPVHLLTREAAEIYRGHLKANGVMAFHVSSRYFDLSPVPRALADPAREDAVLISSKADPGQGTHASDWVLVSGNTNFLATPAIRRATTPWPSSPPPPWTDLHSPLWGRTRTTALTPIDYRQK